MERRESKVPAPRTGRIENLDSLRGLAALVVVANHNLLMVPEFGNLSHLPPPSDFSWFHTILRNSPLRALYDGSAAVVLFFVLSGLALSLPYSAGKREAYVAFVVRRFCRIYLPYAVALLLAVILSTGLSSLRPPGLSEWFQDRNWSEPLNWTTLADYALMLGNHTALDAPIWSLDYEMRVSLFFPFLLPLAFCRRYWGPMIVGGAMLLATFPEFAVSARSPAVQAVCWTMRYGAAFMLGVGVAQAVPDLQRRPRGMLPVFLVGLGLALICLSRSQYVEALAAGLLLIAALLPGAFADFLALPVIRFFGRISYSLYLTHLLILLTSVYLFETRMPLLIVLAIGVGVAIPFGWLFHLWIEEPSRRLGSRWAAVFTRQERGGRAGSLLGLCQLRPVANAATCEPKAEGASTTSARQPVIRQ